MDSNWYSQLKNFDSWFETQPDKAEGQERNKNNENSQSPEFAFSSLASVMSLRNKIKNPRWAFSNIYDDCYFIYV